MNSIKRTLDQHKTTSNRKYSIYAVTVALQTTTSTVFYRISPGGPNFAQLGVFSRELLSRT